MFGEKALGAAIVGQIMAPFAGAFAVSLGLATPALALFGLSVGAYRLTGKLINKMF